MRVLNVTSDRFRETPIDVFAAEPFPFEERYQISILEHLEVNIPFRFVDLDTLISMKQDAGRPKDLVDIEQLHYVKQLNES
jgi:hypothetical protein